MKKIIIIIAAVLVLSLCSCLTMQKEDVEAFQVVAEAAGTRDELYSRARSWFVDSFVSSTAVIEQDDKDGYIIKGKYVDSVQRNIFCTVEIESVITVEIKDGKARLTISAPLSVTAVVDYSRTPTALSKSEVEAINRKRQELFDSFKDFLSTYREDW